MSAATGRSARWAASVAPAESPPQSNTAPTLPEPDAEGLSERAAALAKTAEGLARVLGAQLDSTETGGRTSVVVGTILGLSGMGLSVAESTGLLSAIPPLFAVAGMGFVAAGSLASFLFAGRSASRASATSRLIAADAAASRAWGKAIRRVDTVLAGVYGKTGPRTDEWRMVAALLDHMEREIGLLARQTTVPRGDATAVLRRHERIVPRDTRTTIRVADGRVFSARIADISVSGVAIETELLDVALGTTVMIGHHEARAVRKLRKGIAFEFKMPLDSAEFDPDILL